MKHSLLDYARSTARVPTPLPPQRTRKELKRAGVEARGAWPVDLLPASAIALDLARYGVTYRRGEGYAIGRHRAEADEIARVAVDVLSDAAEFIAEGTADRFARQLAEVEKSIDAAHCQALDDATASEETLSSRVRAATIPAGAALAPGIYELMHDPAVAEADARALGEKWGLRHTADELRASHAARRRLLDAIRPHLPASTTASTFAQQLSRFLSAFDDQDSVRRSALALHYSEAGSPGGVTPSDLRAAAAARWGDPVKLRGHYVYRPKREPQHAPSRRPNASETLESREVADARTYAEKKLELDGERLPIERLRELFDLTEREAQMLAISA